MMMAPVSNMSASCGRDAVIHRPEASKADVSVAALGRRDLNGQPGPQAATTIIRLKAPKTT